MTNSKQHFRDLPDQDLAEWRQRPQTALLAASLSNDARQALDTCANYAGRGDVAPAAWQAGWAACADGIASLIMDKHDDPRATQEVARG